MLTGDTGEMELDAEAELWNPEKLGKRGWEAKTRIRSKKGGAQGYQREEPAAVYARPGKDREQKVCVRQRKRRQLRTKRHSQERTM